MKLVKQFAVMISRLGLEASAPTCPLYATEHPVAKGISLTSQMLEARVGR
ncbi:MAG: hypothetical protein QF384_03075 [Alphaproteobacteria bacterium]|jgi:hypothetical protein|nr:hypothetical protein [Alphaproteobacteria bacterium]MDP6832923.1 hypothetical protein [Alphaproteobacteria bacterium]MDP6872257.1 hypothetical protein [Alphaproteobacteria bacterium]